MNITPTSAVTATTTTTGASTPNTQENAAFAWEYIKKEQEAALAIPVIRVLIEVIRKSQAATIMGLQKDLEHATHNLKQCSFNTSISLNSVCELFIRFVTRTSFDFPNFDQCKITLIERGEQLSKKSANSRTKIAKLADRFIRDGVTILVHGFSRVVLSVLLNASAQGKRFSVIVTESRPDSSGYKLAERLQAAKIPVKLIMDGGVSRIIDKVDYVLCGAEAIVENGGIVNKIGTYQISIVAKAFKKPFYVAAESFKFTRSYPLNQSDIEFLKEEKDTFQACKSCSKCEHPESLTIDSPTLDYTPPSYITLLFTELGVLTPSAVSDELIKLYY
ncbi:translation initiation factor eIF-2B alpha subunit [Cavenderia fasciculata]|uniref:Translation initiation factor eIF2B subunit alpha n=1 Tax=Cavenderia fasciculata TaxID=261658 RepID=F4QEN5_CACFS|nr:translation initiation factor eIF-2B alpha subunit [Cavenderia fasciculata]EGG13296.1 translation initiation factor eIF-2B alpha subunit [Cavenderia fasciculata]|eukprot:XP_004349995.1 translation initiation factor eIF-2B alpha subunit [Cavenderia fasciculata]